jgi:hypothetical protein
MYHYNIDSSLGQSGSALRRTNDDRSVAVHQGVGTTTSGGTSITGNRGVKINSAVIDGASWWNPL